MKAKTVEAKMKAKSISSASPPDENESKNIAAKMKAKTFQVHFCLVRRFFPNVLINIADFRTYNESYIAPRMKNHQIKAWKWGAAATKRHDQIFPR